MSAVAQQGETYFNMAVKGQSNDLWTGAVQEAVLADRDDLSSKELEELMKKNQQTKNLKKTFSVRRLNCVLRHLTRLIYVT